MVAATILVLCGGVAAFPWASGRSRPPVISRLAARAAVERARTGAAARWAPADLSRAEAALRQALAEERRQELRPFLVRNYDQSRESFKGAAQQAERAEHEGDALRDGARRSAEEALLGAETAVADTQRLLGRVPLGASERAALRGARTELATSRRFWNEEGYDQVQSHARRATDRCRAAVARAGTVAARFADQKHVKQWRRWIEDTVTWSRRQGASAIVVYKERNLLRLYEKGRLSRSYSVDLGANNTRDKSHSGDRATPEGRYRITAKKNSGASRYYKALLLDYPNDEDRRRYNELVRKGQAPAGVGPGANIEIHGEGGRGDDWTRGCVALSNRDIDDLFHRVSVGTPVTIVGGDGDNGPLSELARRLAAERESTN